MPTPEDFTITFGFPEFWQEVVERHKIFFEPGNRLQQAVISVTDRAYEGLDSNQHILLNILMLEAVAMTEAVTLIGNGMGHGAMKIVRGMVEGAINAEYIRRFPEQGEKYKEWNWMEMHKLYNYMTETNPDALKEIPPEKVAEDLANYERVKGMFRYNVTGRDGVERVVKQDSWCRENLFERAKLTDCLQMYTTVMPSANQILHGSIGASLAIWSGKTQMAASAIPPTIIGEAKLLLPAIRRYIRRSNRFHELWMSRRFQGWTSWRQIMPLFGEKSLQQARPHPELSRCGDIRLPPYDRWSTGARYTPVAKNRKYGMSKSFSSRKSSARSWGRASAPNLLSG